MDRPRRPRCPGSAFWTCQRYVQKTDQTSATNRKFKGLELLEFRGFVSRLLTSASNKCHGATSNPLLWYGCVEHYKWWLFCLLDRYIRLLSFAVAIQTRNKNIISKAMQLYRRIVTRITRVELITISIVTIRSIWHNSAADFFCVLKNFRRGATYRQNYETFSAL